MGLVRYIWIFHRIDQSLVFSRDRIWQARTLRLVYHYWKLYATLSSSKWKNLIVKCSSWSLWCNAPVRRRSACLHKQREVPDIITWLARDAVIAWQYTIENMRLRISCLHIIRTSNSKTILPQFNDQQQNIESSVRNLTAKEMVAVQKRFSLELMSLTVQHVQPPSTVTDLLPSRSYR